MSYFHNISTKDRTVILTPNTLVTGQYISNITLYWVGVCSTHNTDTHRPSFNNMIPTNLSTKQVHTVCTGSFVRGLSPRFIPMRKLRFCMYVYCMQWLWLWLWPAANGMKGQLQILYSRNMYLTYRSQFWLHKAAFPQRFLYNCVEGLQLLKRSTVASQAFQGTINCTNLHIRYVLVVEEYTSHHVVSPAWS